jgi:GTP-binding protein EngB required for normal cell division
MASAGTGDDRLAALIQLADEAERADIASAARDCGERLRGGLFYVVCLGEAKRGKSTLVNALLEAPVLPTGIVPITAAVTVVRYGPALAARVRTADSDWTACDPSELVSYVSEERNPGNAKGVTGVEVFVPSALLRSGMCLVDTPGIGSVSLANTEATRAFVPHIDAALIVLGADPPVTGDELALVRDVARSVRHVIVVLTKADRHSEAERADAARFTARTLEPVVPNVGGTLLHVSALEPMAGGAPARD